MSNIWGFRYVFQNVTFLTLSFPLSKWYSRTLALLTQCFISLSNHVEVTTGSHKNHKWVGPAIRMSLPSFRLGKTNRMASMISQKKAARFQNMKINVKKLNVSRSHVQISIEKAKEKKSSPKYILSLNKYVSLALQISVGRQRTILIFSSTPVK